MKFVAWPSVFRLKRPSPSLNTELLSEDTDCI